MRKQSRMKVLFISLIGERPLRIDEHVGNHVRVVCIAMKRPTELIVWFS